MKKNIYLVLVHKLRKYSYVLFVVLGLISCHQNKNDRKQPICDFNAIRFRDTLVVGTLYGSSSYFTYKDEPMGFDYELCYSFAEEKGLELDVKTATSELDLVNMLINKEIDLIAYRLSIRNELKDDVLYIKNEYVNNQVLIQKLSEDMLHSVVDLIGKKIYVIPNTKYEERLNNLNQEIGGGIDIQLVEDTLSVDNLIEMVVSGEIKYTVAENDIALLNKTYYQNIDCKVPVSFSQRSAWAVSVDCPILKDTIDKWFSERNEQIHYKRLYNKYFVKSKFFREKKIVIPKGAISPYDSLFIKYSKHLNWDWRLLTAQSYVESRFDSSAVSWAGARGVMQLMPATAAHFDLSEVYISNPEKNIKAASRYLRLLNYRFKEIEDKDERIKFILASYNAGDGHIRDAMALAEKYGKNPTVWDENVETYVLLKSNSEFYTDSVVKYGYCRGNQTYRYVKDVLDKYDQYKKRK